MLSQLISSSTSLIPWLATIYGFTTAVVLILGAALYQFRARHVKGVATPDYIPFFGVLISLWRNWNRVYDYFVDLSMRVGDGQSYCVGMPFTPHHLCAVVLGSSEANAEHMLKKNFANYEKGADLREILRDLMGEGIFNSDGDQWREQRKTASHMFSMRNLKEDMSQVFLKNAYVVLGQLQNLNGKSIDIQDMLFRYTLDSFSEIAFGEIPGCMTTKDVPFATAFDITTQLSNLRLFDPTCRFKQFLNIGSERELRKNVLIIDSYAQNIISHRRRSQMLAEKPDLLSRFIAMGEEKGEELSDTYLRDIVLNFIIAGRDTTAIVMSWALYELSQHPDIEQQVYQEIINAYPQGIPKSQNEIIPSHNLPLLEAVIHETLRLHPSVPMDIKTCVNDDVLPDGTFIPAGTMVVYAPYTFGRSKRLWGPDALTFRPQRWLEQESPSQYKFISFNAGPRLCLGKGVALMESSLLLSMILYKYHLTPVAGQQITYQPSLTAPIKNGFHVHIHPRTTV